MSRTPQPPSELAPHEAAAGVSEHFAFSAKLAALGLNGTLRPEMFPPTVVLPVGNGRIEIGGHVSSEMLKAQSANLIVGAISVSAQVINRALEDTFQGHPLDRQKKGGASRSPTDLDDLEAAREIIYMIRTAVSHDPFRPKWQCRNQRIGEFHVKRLGI